MKYSNMDALFNSENRHLFLIVFNKHFNKRLI